MHPRTDTYLGIELLQITLGKRSELSRTPSVAEWSQIYTFAKEQSLTGVLFDGIERLPKSQRPDVHTLMDWFGQAECLTTINELLDTRCRELTELFMKAGIRSCILKGSGVAKLYPNPRRRCGGDIDIWIGLPRKKALAFIRDHWEMGNVLVYHVDARIFNDVAVEVHYMPAVSYNPWRYRKYKQYFAMEAGKQMMRMDASLGFAHPSVTFHAVYSMIHMFNHALNNEIRLKQIVDYYYIMQHLSISDRTYIMRTLDNMGLKRFAGAMMYALKQLTAICEERMLCEPDIRAGRQLLRDVLSNDNAIATIRNGNRWTMLKTKMQKLSTYITLYPSEILWAPCWKLWHYGWMKMNN